MDMTKIVCYRTRPAVIISKSSAELPTFVATVVYFIEEDNTLKPCIETVFDRAQITEYHCPHAKEAAVPPVYRSDEGKCMYSATPAKLSSMCVACKAESMAEFLRSEDI